MDVDIIMNMGNVGMDIIMITKMSAGAAMVTRMSAVITTIMITEKNVDAVRSMKMSAAITTIMDMEKNVVTPIIMPMKMLGIAAATMAITTTMRTRYSQAGGKRQPINTQTRSLTSC